MTKWMDMLNKKKKKNSYEPTARQAALDTEQTAIVRPSLSITFYSQMDGQMDEGQQHQGGLSPPPLAHFFPIREGGRDESCIFEGICFQMLFFSSDATTYLAREKISKWQLYQQKRSAGR